MTRLIVLLVALFSVTAQEPPPQPGHGPYANRPGWHCYRGETVEAKKLAHCACQLHCDAEGNRQEANDCQTFCDNAHNQCLCHSDEGCEAQR